MLEKATTNLMPGALQQKFRQEIPFTDSVVQTADK